RLIGKHDRIRTAPDLLASAKLESGALDLNIEEMPLRISSRKSSRAANRNAARETSAPSSGSRSRQIVGNRFRLDQALDNLVVNALRHTPDGGRIELRALHADRGVRLIVWDSAGAIAESHLPFIFDRFYKVESAHGVASPGSGLGLSIVKAIVTRHHGRVTATSAPDVGTTFTIELPVNANQVASDVVTPV
ncbi:MAG: ATP-binding protein, partial [Vicinamibacterales bacterium]